MTLRTDGESTVEQRSCDECGRDDVLVRTLVLDAEGPHAIAFTALHHHHGSEAWMDVVFGAFEGDAEEDDRTTFGCRVGPVEGSPEPGATAVAAAVPYDDGPVFRRKLSRDEALAHPRLRDFWDVVDFLLVNEPAVNHHVYGHLPPATTGPS